MASPKLLVMRMLTKSAEQQRQDQKQVSNKDNTDMTVSFFHSHSLFLSVSFCLFLVPAAPWSACQLFQCLCSLSKSFYSDSQWNFVSVSQLSTQSPTPTVRHSRYTLLIIAKLTSAAAAFFNLFIVEYLMCTGQVEQYENLAVYFHLNFNWTSHVVIIIYAHELKSELLNRIRSGGWLLTEIDVTDIDKGVRDTKLQVWACAYVQSWKTHLLVIWVKVFSWQTKQ